MRRFADPVKAINYLAESERTRPRSPHKVTYFELARRTGIHHITLWRILKGRTTASRHIAEKLQATAEKEARKRKKARS
jgi:hypothetical protein